MGAPTTPAKPVANRGKPSSSRSAKRQYVDLTKDEAGSESPVKKRKTSPKKENVEKRPKRWRDHAPNAYHDRLERAMSQKMFVLDRRRNSNTASLSEEITMAGTTGNIYTVTIASVPSCTCPDAGKGNQCKHIIYTLTRILKPPTELRYQLSFLPSELASIFASSPLPTETVSEDDADSEYPSNRKPSSGDCPICFCDMDDDDPKDIVWCKAACGNNVHKACFAKWAKNSKASSGSVRCVYCRTEWEGEGILAGAQGWNGTAEELAALKANASVSADGYANIASDLGISQHRDYSSYHQPWVNSRYSSGGGSGGWGYGRRR